jgi:hypothetical protein
MAHRQPKCAADRTHVYFSFPTERVSFRHFFAVSVTGSALLTPLIATPNIEWVG